MHRTQDSCRLDPGAGLRRPAPPGHSHRLLALGARALLKERILERPNYGAGTQIDVASPFLDLAELWLEELAVRAIAERTKDDYRDMLRLHVGPALHYFTLGEITTGRVEWFLTSQCQCSASQARRARTLLNQLFCYALRHDALTRNPVEGTSPIPRASGAPQALSLEEGGTGASVRHLDPSDNRGAGSTMGNALTDHADGTKVVIYAN